MHGCTGWVKDTSQSLMYCHNSQHIEKKDRHPSLSAHNSYCVFPTLPCISFYVLLPRAVRGNKLSEAPTADLEFPWNHPLSEDQSFHIIKWHHLLYSALNFKNTNIYRTIHFDKLVWPNLAKKKLFRIFLIILLCLIFMFFKSLSPVLS